MARNTSIRRWAPEQPGQPERLARRVHLQRAQPERHRSKTEQQRGRSKQRDHSSDADGQSNHRNDDACGQSNHNRPELGPVQRPEPRLHNRNNHHDAWRLPSSHRPTGRSRRPRRKSRCLKLTCDSSRILLQDTGT